MATLARQSIEIDNPSIGGRNLWPCSKEFLNKILSDRRVYLSPSYATGGGYKGFTSRKVTASSSSYSYSELVELSMSSGTFEYGDLFTLSFYAKGSGTFDCYFWGDSGYVKTAVVSCSPTSACGLNHYGDGCYKHTVPSTWTKFVVTWKLDTTGDLTKRKIVLFRALTGTILEVCGIKFEKGTVATDWTPAPEDKADQVIIDDWTSDAIKDGVTKINGGYIQTQTIKSEHLIVEDIFATGSAAMNIISARELNADLITSGTINANFLSLYGMKVLNKTTDQETLNITDNGEITLRGSVESYNYNSGKTGWAIKHDGDAEFNDVVVRGSVITNDGGIVSSGGSGRNLFANSNFQETTTQTLWNTTKNGNLLATQWNGYNRGVANASSCYHAHLYNFQGENVYRYKKETEAWLGICYSGSLLKSIEPGGTYTFSCQLYRVSGANTSTGGLYYYQKGETSASFHSGQYNFTNKMEQGNWVDCSYTFTIPSDIDLSKYVSWYCYGATNSDPAGEFYLRRPKLEKGSIATPWSPAPEDNLKQVRFWAGASYDEREAAPWIVYNDGSMVATKGTFSGVFSGDIKIGNISITDPSSSTGNDAILTIINGSTGVEAVQLTDRGTSVFRQSVVFRSASAGSTDTTISLEPNGTGIFKSSVQVGSGANVAGLENDKLVIRGHTLTHNSSGLQSNSDFFVGEAAHKKNLKTYGDMYATGVVRTDDMVLFADKAQMKIVANGLNIDVFNS